MNTRNQPTFLHHIQCYLLNFINLVWFGLVYFIPRKTILQVINSFNSFIINVQNHIRTISIEHFRRHHMAFFWIFFFRLFISFWLNCKLHKWKHWSYVFNWISCFIQSNPIHRHHHRFIITQLSTNWEWVCFSLKW